MTTKSERTQQRIIDAANQLFYRKGYNRTSFTDVVDEAEVPRGNIYYYFKAKEEMLRAVIKHRMETTTLMLSEWEKSIKTPLDRLERFVQIMYDSTPALLRSGCPMGSLNVELAKDQPELKSDAKQFAQMGYPEEARELSLELLARGQGIIVIAQVYQDPGFLERGTKEINRWLENLDRYA